MKIENRQHFLIMLVAVGAALLIGNSLIYSPLAKLWSARSLQIRNLKNQVADGKNLIKSATTLSNQWSNMTANCLPSNFAGREPVAHGAHLLVTQHRRGHHQHHAAVEK